MRLFDLAKNAFADACRSEVFVAAGHSHMATTLDGFGQFRRTNVLQVTLTGVDGKELSRGIYIADIERHMAFPDAKLDVNVSGRDLTIRTDRFARCVELSGNDGGDEFGWGFDDNTFDLLPGESRHVRVLGRHDTGTITARAHYASAATVVPLKG